MDREQPVKRTGMVLVRRLGETIRVGDAEITVNKITRNGTRVDLFIEAPLDVPVWRKEVWLRKQNEQATKD